VSAQRNAPKPTPIVRQPLAAPRSLDPFEPSNEHVLARHKSAAAIAFYTHISDRFAPFHTKVGASPRAIARELRVSRSTVKEYLARGAAAGLAWALPAELTDAVLEERLFAAGGPRPGSRRRIEPDWTEPPRRPFGCRPRGLEICFLC
jgi:hypothetical protein